MANEKRLIDAYKLEDLLRTNSGRYHHKDDVIAAIAGQPTVDAVEVVRCKECVSSMYFPHTEKCWCKAPFGMVGNTPVDPNGFCSYGERKEKRT